MLLSFAILLLFCRFVVLAYVMLCHCSLYYCFMCYVVLYYVLFCYVLFCFVMVCYAMLMPTLCCVKLSYVMLLHDMLHFIHALLYRTVLWYGMAWHYTRQQVNVPLTHGMVYDHRLTCLSSRPTGLTCRTPRRGY